MKLEELIKGVVSLGKIKVALLAKEKISNKEKKTALDKAIYGYIEKFIETVPMNFIFKFVIKKVILENIPALTQAMYDLIKSKVEGVRE